MLTMVIDKNAVSKCQEILANVLSETLDKSKNITIGFPSGSWQAKVRHNSTIWHHNYEINEPGKARRYWNGFGLADEINSRSSLNIVVEINIPFEGVNKRVSGFFAEDRGSGDLYLMHRGKIGGGRKNIGKSAFVNWSQAKLVKVLDGENVEFAMKVAKINGKDAVKNISSFVTMVSDLKMYLTSDEFIDTSLLSIEELYSRAKESTGRKISYKTISVYDRDPIITEIAKRLANGSCQLCRKKAPFKDGFGKPYLETHHIKWLSRGGEDTVENTVALCPNCHRKIHALDLPEDIVSLRNRVGIMTNNVKS